MIPTASAAAWHVLPAAMISQIRFLALRRTQYTKGGEKTAARHGQAAKLYKETGP